jgi:hypothetical protein
MPGECYRLKTPTLAIMVQESQRIPVTIPLGGVVRLVDGPLNGERLVDVEWEAKPLLMFSVDLRERGEIVEAASN